MQEPLRGSVRWTSAVVAGSMAAVVLLAAGNWGLREVSAQSEMGYSTSLSDVPVRLIIGDGTFLIPKNFIWSRDNWRGGKTDGVNLHALLPGLEPYTASNRAEFEKPGWNRKITLVIGEHSTPRRPATLSRELVFERRMKGVRFREVDGPNGLRRLVIEGKPPAVPREHFISRSRNGDFYFVSCWPDETRRSPSCTTTLQYSKHVYVQYRFSKSRLNDWQVIDAGILTLVKRFESK